MRAGIGLEGRFKLEAFNPETGEKRSTGWFDNLILNQGLDVMGTVAPLNYCRVGTSDTPVDASQTTLMSQSASTNSVNSTTYGWDTTNNLYGWHRKIFRFAAGAATGTLREVGVGYASTTSLFSRALIADSGGTPTPFVVGAGEILDVAYELRYYPKITDTVTVVNINGTDHTFTIRPSKADSSMADVNGIRFLGSSGSTVGMQGMNSSQAYTYQTVTSFGDYLSLFTATGQNSSSSTVVISPYVNGSYERNHSFTFTPAQGSFPIQLITFPSACGFWKALVDPPIPKDSTKQLTITTKITWGRRA